MASRASSVAVAAPPGQIAFYRRGRPTNVYLAFPASSYQVEVFDPVAARARKLVAEGNIQGVTGGSGAAAVPKTAVAAVSLGGLRALSAQLGRPIYWAGDRAGSTYELTRTLDGRVYLRYLPAGVKVGVDQPHLTVATYPLQNAYMTTASAAKRPGSVTIPVASGIAFYAESHPTSVYLAFPGVNQQIEVFDPSPALVHRAVAAGQISRIR